MGQRKSYVVNGLLLSNVREFSKFIFGNFYIRAEINRQENIIEIMLRSKLNVKQEDGSFKEETIDDYVNKTNFNKHFHKRLKILTHEENKS